MRPRKPLPITDADREALALRLVPNSPAKRAAVLRSGLLDVAIAGVDVVGHARQSWYVPKAKRQAA